MRPIRPSRATAKRHADKQAAMIIQERGPRCQICGRMRRLEAHEIARGNADRKKARGARFATLVVCRECHGELDYASRWPKEKQLALRLVQCPHDYDLGLYNHIDAPPILYQEDVDRFVPEIQEMLNANFDRGQSRGSRHRGADGRTLPPWAA